MKEELEFKYSVRSKNLLNEIANGVDSSGVKWEKQKECMLRNVYLDTKEHKLLESDSSLRFRTTKNTSVLTFKSKGNNSENGLFSHFEDEEKINANLWQDAINLETTPLLRAKKIIGDEAILPILITDCNRLFKIGTLPCKTQFELSLDYVSYLEFENESFCELEIELIKGNIKALRIFADTLATRFKLTPSVETKMAKGMRLVKKRRATR